MWVTAFKVGMNAPDDVSEAARLLDESAFRAEHVVAILGKTEGNGGVNDWTRGLATLSFQLLLSERGAGPREQIARRVPVIWSGGTEGLMSPHATIFVKDPTRGQPGGPKRFTVGTAYTRDLLPEEFGRMEHVKVAAEGVRQAIADAEIDDAADIHFVQIKTGALTSERIRDARQRGHEVVTKDTYGSMGYARAVAALGVGLSTGEIAGDGLDESVIARDFSLFSDVASTSSGVELMNCEIIVMGNSSRVDGDCVMAHDVMQDTLDTRAICRALQAAGLRADDGLLVEAHRERLINVFAKCEPGPDGSTRGRRHVMFEDSDVNYTRHIRGAANAVVASVTGDPMAYVSAGAEHQGPPGGGVVAVLARLAT